MWKRNRNLNLQAVKFIMHGATLVRTNQNILQCHYYMEKQPSFTCWWTSAMDMVKFRNTLIVASTTALFACCNRSSSKFMISNVSFGSAGRYFATSSRTRHCAHSLKSLILFFKKSQININRPQNFTIYSRK